LINNELCIFKEKYVVKSGYSLVMISLITKFKILKDLKPIQT